MMMYNRYPKQPVLAPRLVVHLQEQEGARNSQGRQALDQIFESENAAAQYNLGVKYYNGSDGMPKDYAKASELYFRAASKGHVLAKNNLGVMYRKGLGVPQSEERAFTLYLEAASEGCAIAQYNELCCIIQNFVMSDTISEH
jgi:TPR repeat protein